MKSRKKQDVTDENHKMVEMFMTGFQGEETYKKVWVYGSQPKIFIAIFDNVL